MEIGLCDQSLDFIGHFVVTVSSLGAEGHSNRNYTRTCFSMEICPKSGVGWNVAVCIKNCPTISAAESVTETLCSLVRLGSFPSSNSLKSSKLSIASRHSEQGYS